MHKSFVILKKIYGSRNKFGMTDHTMPELPEVETIRLRLHKNLVGRIIKNVTVIRAKQFIGSKKDIIGKKVISVIRKGKVISFKLSNEKYISIHLKMSGQLLFAENKKDVAFNSIIPFAKSNIMPGKTTRIVIVFEDDAALFFNDLRTFGWMKVGKQPEGPQSIDVLSPDFTEEYLQKVTEKTRKPIKVLLMDQEALAGIGNIYANDSLFIAKINPLRLSNTLSPDEVERLYKSIQEIIAEGLLYRGSSARDEVYVMPDGSKGSYQEHFKVYHRENKPCLRCKTPIKRIKQGGRSSFYCPICQI